MQRSIRKAPLFSGGLFGVIPSSGAGWFALSRKTGWLAPASVAGSGFYRASAVSWYAIPTGRQHRLKDSWRSPPEHFYFGEKSFNYRAGASEQVEDTVGSASGRFEGISTFNPTTETAVQQVRSLTKMICFRVQQNAALPSKLPLVRRA
jgi:hypothetical protein